jgi:hypothetical protein
MPRIGTMPFDVSPSGPEIVAGIENGAKLVECPKVKNRKFPPI